MVGPLGRAAAALICLVALAGLVIQFVATQSGTHDVVLTIWILLRFFTVLTNILVAIVFGGIALGKTFRPTLVAGAVLAILLVGIVYGLLLRGLLELSGGALLADTVLHKITPILAALWWLLFMPKGGLGRHDPWLWAIYPSAYLPYALARGLSGDIYAYPFINVDRLGWGQVLVNAFAIALGFVAAGFGLVALDRWLGVRRASPPPPTR
jgi:hypothetical protein